MQAKQFDDGKHFCINSCIGACNHSRLISNMTALLLGKHLPESLHVPLRFMCLQNSFQWACSVLFNALPTDRVRYNSRNSWHPVHACIAGKLARQSIRARQQSQLYESRPQHLCHQYRVLNSE